MTMALSACAPPNSWEQESNMAKTDLDNTDELRPQFDSAGLITAIAQDADSGEILMLAHMNAEALARTLATREVHYWSRSRQSLWHKGESSGQIQHLVRARLDCDQDAILLQVRVGGDQGACHVGYRSCFYREIVAKSPGDWSLRPVAKKIGA